MEKKAQNPYGHVGLTPTLAKLQQLQASAPESSSPDSESGYGKWLIPGAIASGLLGYILLKGRNRALEKATKRIVNPIKEVSKGKPHLQSPLYPDSILGIRAGELAQESMQKYPQQILPHLENIKDWSFLHKDIKPTEIISGLKTLAQGAK